VSQAEEYDKEIVKIREKEEGLHKDKTSLLMSKIQMESFDNPKYKLLLADVTDQLLVIETSLQRLRESRINLKDGLDQVNRYSHEGEVLSVRVRPFLNWIFRHIHVSRAEHPRWIDEDEEEDGQRRGGRGALEALRGQRCAHIHRAAADDSQAVECVRLAAGHL
jgi:hypothetical protein